MNEADARNMELQTYMSLQAYNEHGGVPPEGWTVLADSKELGIGNDTGYYGVAYQNIEHPEHVEIAERGTQFRDDFQHDVLGADRQVLLHEVPGQYQDDMKFTEAVAEAAHLPASMIDHTGHSLGMVNGDLTAIATGAHGYGINGPGVQEQLPALEIINGVPAGTYQNADLSDRLTTYALEGDKVSEFGTQTGTVVQIENPGLAEPEQNAQFARELPPTDEARAEIEGAVTAAEAFHAAQYHSDAYVEALAQDATAQSRMGPIYGPPDATLMEHVEHFFHLDSPPPPTEVPAAPEASLPSSDWASPGFASSTEASPFSSDLSQPAPNFDHSFFTAPAPVDESVGHSFFNEPFAAESPSSPSAGWVGASSGDWVSSGENTTSSWVDASPAVGFAPVAEASPGAWTDSFSAHDSGSSFGQHDHAAVHETSVSHSHDYGGHDAGAGGHDSSGSSHDAGFGF